MLNEEELKNLTDTLIREQKDQIIFLFNKGCHLDEICRCVKLDIDTVLEVIRKCKYKKKELYVIYEYQDDRNINKKTRMDVQSHLLNKFFPLQDDDYFFSNSYHLYYKEKLKRKEKLKKECTHPITHIRCGICGKILADGGKKYKKLKK
jgi:hypothetical protein